MDDALVARLLDVITEQQKTINRLLAQVIPEPPTQTARDAVDHLRPIPGPTKWNGFKAEMERRSRKPETAQEQQEQEQRRQYWEAQANAASDELSSDKGDGVAGLRTDDAETQEKGQQGKSLQ